MRHKLFYCGCTFSRYCHLHYCHLHRLAYRKGSLPSRLRASSKTKWQRPTYARIKKSPRPSTSATATFKWAKSRSKCAKLTRNATMSNCCSPRSTFKHFPAKVILFLESDLLAEKRLEKGKSDVNQNGIDLPLPKFKPRITVSKRLS